MIRTQLRVEQMKLIYQKNTSMQYLQQFLKLQQPFTSKQSPPYNYEQIQKIYTKVPPISN
jgi:hypothetical protein